MTLLRFSPGPTLRVRRNLEFAFGRDFRLPYTAELLASDFAAGVGIAQVILVISNDFGQNPLLTKTITTALSSSGQITDDATTDGKGAFYFTLTSSEMHAFTTPVAFEVMVVDTIGRNGSFDYGALSPDVSMAGAPVDHVTVAPAVFSVTSLSTQQLVATAYDAQNNVLTGRVITWSSSAPTVASVSSTGLVTGALGGTATITATSEGKVGTSAATVVPMTAAQFRAAFNAAGPAQMDGLFIKGAANNQTIVADGSSPSGFRCTLWDDATIPGQGKHGRPTSGFTGAPCSATGDVFAEGLEWPTSTGFGTVTPDTTLPTAVGSTGLKDGLFADRTKGRMYIAVGNLHWQHDYVLVGENDGTGLRYRGQDQFRYYIVGGAGGLAYGASCVHATYSGSYPDATQEFGAPGTKRLSLVRVARDIINTGQPYQNSISGPDLTVGGPRRVRLFPSSVFGSVVGTAATSSTPMFAVTAGRPNAAQWKILHDWVETQTWGVGVYNDTRNWVGYGGDSYDQSVQAVDLINGVHTGVPAMANVAMIAGWDQTQPWGFDSSAGYAQAAMDPHVFQYPILSWTARDMDTSKRSTYVWRWSEWQNAGNVPNALPQNYYLADTLKAISPKFKVVMFESTRGNNSSGGENYALNIDLETNYGAHADSLSQIWRMSPNSSFHFGPDEQPNKKTYAWLNADQDSSQHPKALAKELWNEDTRLHILKMLGTDVSNYTSWVKPSVDNIALTAGGATAQPTWTLQTITQTVPTGKTLSFTSDRPYIASVDAVTGVITPLQGGSCVIKAVSNDGGVGFTSVTVAMPAPGVQSSLSHTFTGADSTTTPGVADTGQGIAAQIGTFGRKTNRCYLVNPQSGFEMVNKVLFDGTKTGNATWSIIVPAVESLMGFVFGCQDLSYGYMVHVDVDNKLYVFRIDNNDQLVIHPEQAVSGGLQAGDMYRVTRTASTNTYLVELVRGGSTIASHTIVDAVIQGGRYCGPYCTWIGTTGSWDNLTGA